MSTRKSDRAKRSTPQKVTPKTKLSASQVNSSLPIGTMLETLEACFDHHPMADVTQNNPYKVLMACILSLRTKDEVTIPASIRLFALADTPEKMVTLSSEEIQKAIYPSGFYKTKADTLITISQDLIDRFNSGVPDTIEELLTLKGVGRKTANLVVGLGHGLPAICVDVHVHRICNRFGYIQTETPDETEFVLRAHLPLPYWAIINKVLVLHGREICRPIGPHCDRCPVTTHCQKVAVTPRKSAFK
jgi:endonuclease III